jgi:hypothetical protein
MNHLACGANSYTVGRSSSSVLNKHRYQQEDANQAEGGKGNRDYLEDGHGSPRVLRSHHATRLENGL